MRQPFGTRRLWILSAALVVILSGCGGDEPSRPTVEHFFGEALAPGPPGDAAACQARIRSEEAVAARIRTNLVKAGLMSDPATVKAAAANPAADIAILGIPLTPAELAALRTSGIGADTTLPLAMWVQVGAPDRFGGMWFDGAVATIAVVAGDPATLAVARCLEGATTVRYVWAGTSQLAGEALKDRVSADLDAWRGRGVLVNMVDFDETKGVVTVGLSVVTDELRRQFGEMYGPLVRLEVVGPGQPL